MVRLKLRGKKRLLAHTLTSSVSFNDFNCVVVHYGENDSMFIRVACFSSKVPPNNLVEMVWVLEKPGIWPFPWVRVCGYGQCYLALNKKEQGMEVSPQSAHRDWESKSMTQVYVSSGDMLTSQWSQGLSVSHDKSNRVPPGLCPPRWALILSYDTHVWTQHGQARCGVWCASGGEGGGKVGSESIINICKSVTAFLTTVVKRPHGFEF